jgi:magnesium chelatase subunit I
VPRISDLGALLASTSGKIELETLNDGSEDKVLGKLLQRALLNVFNKSFGGGELDEVVKAFQGGASMVVSDRMPVGEYVKQVGQVPALQAAVRKLEAVDPPSVAAAAEFVLEGLHLSRKLNKDAQARDARYRA